MAKIKKLLADEDEISQYFVQKSFHYANKNLNNI